MNIITAKAPSRAIRACVSVYTAFTCGAYPKDIGFVPFVYMTRIALSASATEW